MSENPADINAAIERVSAAVDAAVETVNDSQPGTDMTLTTDNAVTTKARLAANYGTAVKARAAAEEAALEARKIIEGAEAMLRAKMKELEPLLAHAKRLEDGINAVNLYLGRDEYIEAIQEGVPAAAGTPLTIRQTVLHMDEESALFAESGGMDARNIGNFIAWMLSTPENLDQVLPEQLSVVSIRARRDPKEYGDPWTNMSMAKANSESWWLIRNGQQIFLHTTEFSVGSRLVPGRDEFNNMFLTRDRDGKKVSLEPGSSAWLKAEAASDAYTRHYMKIALILQGLVDRTTVFHPLPVAGLNILSQEHYDLGFVKIVADEDLVLGIGRPAFDSWKKEKLQALTVGHRVLGHFPEDHSKYGSPRVTPPGASRPLPLVAHTITREDNDHFYITYDRTDSVYRPNAPWGEESFGPAKTKASYSIDKSFYDAAFLPVDGVDPEDLAYYLQSRQDRHHYRTLFPAIKAAIAFIELEAAQEAPFRMLIANELQARSLVDPDGADGYAGELMAWWKTANKWHRALNGDGAHERKAQDGVLREAERRAGGSADEKRIVGIIRLEAPNAIAVARRTNDYVAVTMQPRKYEHAAADVFVTVSEFTKTGKLRTTKEWVNLTAAQTSRWTILHATDKFATLRLNVKTKFFLTDPQIDFAVEAILAIDTDASATPVTIAIREGEDGYSSPVLFTMYTRSYYKTENHFGGKTRTTFVQGTRQIGATPQKDGSVDLDLFRNKASSKEWTTTSPFDRDSPVRAEAPHEIRYGNRANPNLTVYRNEEEILREFALGAEWHAQSKAARKMLDRGQSLYMVLCRDWEARALTAAHARFMDDFQDESLWEGHKKAMGSDKLTYPYRRSTKPAEYYDDALRALGQAIAAGELGDVEHHGRSVAELLPLTTVAVKVPLPADVTELRFPSLVPSTERVVK